MRQRTHQRTGHSFPLKRECLRIDAMCPLAQIAKATVLQHLQDPLGGYHDSRRWAMEVPK